MLGLNAVLVEFGNRNGTVVGINSALYDRLGLIVFINLRDLSVLNLLVDLYRTCIVVLVKTAADIVNIMVYGILILRSGCFWSSCRPVLMVRRDPGIIP